MFEQIDDSLPVPPAGFPDVDRVGQTEVEDAGTGAKRAKPSVAPDCRYGYVQDFRNVGVCNDLQQFSFFCFHFYFLSFVMARTSIPVNSLILPARRSLAVRVPSKTARRCVWDIPSIRAVFRRSLQGLFFSFFMFAIDSIVLVSYWNRSNERHDNTIVVNCNNFVAMKSDFSRKLALAMKNNVLTQMKLAQKSGLSQTAISNYLNGRVPKSAELAKLANALGVSCDYLLGKANESCVESQPMPLPDGMRERLVELRGESTQADFAGKVGLDSAKLCSYETGASSPSADAIIKICRATGCSADWLLGLSKSKCQGADENDVPAARAKPMTNADDVIQSLFDVIGKLIDKIDNKSQEKVAQNNDNA